MLAQVACAAFLFYQVQCNKQRTLTTPLLAGTLYMRHASQYPKVAAHAPLPLCALHTCHPPHSPPFPSLPPHASRSPAGVYSQAANSGRTVWYHSLVVRPYERAPRCRCWHSSRIASSAAPRAASLASTSAGLSLRLRGSRPSCQAGGWREGWARGRRDGLRREQRRPWGAGDRQPEQAL